MAQASVRMFYQGVIDDVIMNVRDAFIDEGFDEQTLTELKQLWERKVIETKATERESPVTRISQPVQSHGFRGASNLPNQLKTVASENMLAQTALHYTAQSGGESKPSASQNAPVKINFSVPARLAQAGLHTLLSTVPPGSTTVQIPQELSHLLQNNVLQPVSQSNLVQHAGQQLPGVQYRVLSAEQLQGTQQFAVAFPVAAQSQKQPSTIVQLDGTNDDTSDEDDLSYSEDDDDEEARECDVDEDPLNSSDDVSEEETVDVFDADNVVVCQYDKIGRSKNKWKLHLKDGIMNLHGKDYIFHKVMGDTEW